MSIPHGPLGMIALIFGGCCSNVFALEKILKQHPDSGLVITLVQFLLAASLAWPSILPSLKKASPKPEVPISRWAVIATMFYAVNMLNNWAFAFSISVPVHIILRSFGSVWTMLAGYLRGKRFSALQIFSVALLTAGVVFSAWADAESKGKDFSAQSTASTFEFVAGLTLLLVAQILSAYMGVYVQDTYAMYHATWQTNLFWSHFLGIPMFLPLAPELRRQYDSLQKTAPIGVMPQLASLPFSETVASVPSGMFYLGLNAVTQVLCISGVNLLSSRSSAVTVTIVLNIRKLVSFLASNWIFGHPVSDKMAVGAALVFGSGALYGWETSWRLAGRKEAASGNKKEKAR